MRQAWKGAGRMEDAAGKQERDKQEESQRKMLDIIREEHSFRGDEEQAMEIIKILLKKPGKTVEDALDTLMDARTILLRYHYIT